MINILYRCDMFGVCACLSGTFRGILEAGLSSRSLVWWREFLAGESCGTPLDLLSSVEIVPAQQNF